MIGASTLEHDDISLELVVNPTWDNLLVWPYFHNAKTLAFVVRN